MTTRAADRAEINAEDVLRNVFGITAPLTPETLAAFGEDMLFVENLWIARRNPAFVEVLLAHPPTRSGLAGLSADADAKFEATSPSEWWRLLAEGTVSQDVYEQRLAVCAACPHLTAAATTFQRMASILAPAGRKSVCQLCGCPIANKARLAGADCPARDPRKPELSRWRAAAESGPYPTTTD